MNVENIKFAIEVMREATNLNMCSFQEGDEDEVDTVEQLHACGNTACFVGYLALTDKYKDFVKACFSNSILKLKVAQDGTIDCYDDNGFNNSASFYLSNFLEIDPDTAHALIYGYSDKYGYNKFYNKEFGLVKPEDVIAKLELILSGELE